MVAGGVDAGLGLAGMIAGVIEADLGSVGWLWAM